MSVWDFIDRSPWVAFGFLVVGGVLVEAIVRAARRQP